MRWAGFGLLFALLMAGDAKAQFARLRTNDFQLDAITTPVLGSARTIGLGGAHTALAEGTGGVPFNSAAYAARSPWEFRWYSFDLVFGITLPWFPLTTNDYFNNGRGEGYGVDSYRFVDIGGRVQFGDIGAGMLINSERYTINTDEGAVATRLIHIHFGGGYSLFDGQLVVGFGPRVLQFSMLREEILIDPLGIQRDTPLLESIGVGFEAGVIARPENIPIRIGLSLSTGVNTPVTDRGGTEAAGGLVLPYSVRIPWEVRMGVAWQLGRRPFNARYMQLKDVRGELSIANRRNRCERERAQIGVERGARFAESLRCPDLEVHARDPEWRRAEAIRREREERDLELEASAAEDAMYTLWGDVYRAQPRRYLLLTMDLVLQGATENGIGVDGFLRQEVSPRGRGLSFGLHFGVEGEPWRNRLKIRAGSYLEPHRVEETSRRLHGTFGFDLRVLRLFGDDWFLGFVFDGARDFVSWGFTIGVWH